MRTVILFIGLPVLVAIATYAIVKIMGWQRSGVTPTDTSLSAYRNHQAMARVLDHLVTDDMVYMGADQRELIRDLLDDFYGNQHSLPKGK
jgi:hypothetical protein